MVRIDHIDDKKDCQAVMEPDREIQAQVKFGDMCNRPSATPRLSCGDLRQQFQ